LKVSIVAVRESRESRKEAWNYFETRRKKGREMTLRERGWGEVMTDPRKQGP
jgi:hypothetical protein